MRLRDLERMHAVESEHWWFTGKRILFRRLLTDRLAPGGLRILDVGCGTGAVSRQLSAFGTVCSLDCSSDALRFARTRGLQCPVVGDAARLPFRASAFDLVTAFDIIEHVEDDLAMAGELRRVVAPGGALAVHVPAWPSLFGRHDEVLEHKRRYTRKSLAKLLTTAGFRLEYLGWASCAILAPALILRTAEKLIPRGSNADSELADVYPLPRPLNRLMINLYKVEAALASRGALPFGLSLAAIAAVDPAP